MLNMSPVLSLRQVKVVTWSWSFLMSGGSGDSPRSFIKMEAYLHKQHWSLSEFLLFSREKRKEEKEPKGQGWWDGDSYLDGILCSKDDVTYYPGYLSTSVDKSWEDGSVDRVLAPEVWRLESDPQHPCDTLVVAVPMCNQSLSQGGGGAGSLGLAG